MNRTECIRQLGTITRLYVFLGAGILLTGCGAPQDLPTEDAAKVAPTASPTEDAAKATTKAPAAVPVKVLSADERAAAAEKALEEERQDELVTQIGNEKDLFAFHAMKEEYEKQEDTPKAVLVALTK